MRISLGLVTVCVGLLSATSGALAYDPAFNVAGKPEPQLTLPCVPHSTGCRADGFPDARYYRPALEGRPGMVYNENGPSYYAPQAAPVQARGSWEFLRPSGRLEQAG